MVKSWSRWRETEGLHRFVCKRAEPAPCRPGKRRNRWVGPWRAWKARSREGTARRSVPLTASETRLRSRAWGWSRPFAATSRARPAARTPPPWGMSGECQASCRLDSCCDWHTLRSLRQRPQGRRRTPPHQTALGNVTIRIALTHPHQGLSVVVHFEFPPAHRTPGKKQPRVTIAR